MNRRRFVKMDTEKHSETNIDMRKEQMVDGRLWINKYFSNLEIENIVLNQIILFDQIRSCLLFAKQDVDAKLFWNHLNKNSCN